MSVPGLVDQSARERIATALDQNLCVEAAAGTGKTTVLVSRVVGLLASGRVTVDELVVITFTEKAAAELATRVRDTLEQQANAASGEQRERLHAAARGLYRAHIETIHSFATALLRERPVEAGLDPLFEVLEGLTGSLDFDAAYERFQDQLFSQQLPELDRAMRRGFGLSELREACQHLNEHRYLLPLAHPAVSDDIARPIATLGRIEDELRDLLTRHQPPGDDKAIPVIEAILDWVARLQGADVATQERMLIAGGPKAYPSSGTAGNWGGEKPRLKELREEYAELVSDTGLRLRSHALVGLLGHVESFVETYEQERRRAGTADFDDLLFWARDLLRDSRPAREYFRRRFRAVLIDEFQDTDPVQGELALLLTSDDNPGEDWRQLTPGPGRLTVVGDPKQSIYRFRRADIAVYERVKDGPLAGGSERISTNFRSNPALLSALNTVFDRVLQAEPGLQPGNVALEPAPGAAVAQRPPVVLVEGAVQGDAGDLRQAEAGALTGLLHRLHEERWEIRDRRDGDRWRPCRWGDMAILMPARTGLELYEEALAGAGIPYRHEGSRDFFERDEVRDLIWVLAAIDDPTDRIALVGALRSSAFAISDQQLVIHAAQNGALSYFAKRGPSEPVNGALAELRELHNLRGQFSLAEVIRRVVERARLVEFALTRPDGEQAAANLLAIVDDARLFAAAGGGGLRPFIRYLRASMENEAIEIEATVAEETDDVVRIMTAHGAKGLEYPIVALANLGTRPQITSEPVAREEESVLHFRVGTESGYGHFPTPGYQQVWEGEKAHFVAEKLRLLYVAATRARDHLLVPCVTGQGSAPHLLGELVRNLPVDDPDLVCRIALEDLDPPAVDSETDDQVTDAQVDAAVCERDHWIAASDELKQRAGAAREIETASSRERARGPLAAEVMTYGATLLVGDGPPLPVGDAVHMVMERISFPDGADLAVVADDVCKEGAITEQTDDVIAMCRACLDAPSVRRAAASQRYWREVPFVLSRAADPLDADRGPMVNGRVDLVYAQNGELAVVDYKTDKNVTKDTAEQHALEHHSGQAEVYAQALAAATGMPVHEVVFVYCKAGTEVRLRDGKILD